MAVANRKSSERKVRARKQLAMASAIGVVVERLEERRLLSLTNGGFESPDVGSGSYQASPSDAGWSFYDAGIASNGASELGSVAVPGGSQAAVLGAMGSLSQTFNPGGAGIYYLQLHAAVSAYGPSFQVSIDGNQVGSTFYGSSEAGALITTPLFALADGAHTLEINGGSGLVIDDVALTPVPFAPPSLGVDADYLSTGIVKVGWSDPGWPDVTGSYSVERSLDGVQFTTVPSGSVTQNADHSWSLEDPTLPGTGYSYRVVASYTIPGDTNFQLTSGVASITTPSSGVPSPVATAVWAHAVDVQIPENDPAGPFDLLRSTDGVNYALLATINTSVFHDTNVLPETTYYYRLQSQTYPQEGQMSDAASVTTPRELLIHLGSGQTRVTQGGRSFVLDLNAAGNPVGTDLVGWDIDWGDGGAVQHVAGAPQSVPHSYSAPGNYHVSAVLDWQSYHYPVYGLSFDTSFGGGMVRGSFGSVTGDSANAVATLPTGRVLVAGNSGGSFALSQFLADGTPDPLFGIDGLTTTSFGPNYTARGAAVAVADGKYLVAGDVYSTASGYDFALARYNADGTLDQSFGNGGTVITDFASDARANAVAVQANGDIVVAGFTGGNFAVAHYHADGTPDTSWGGGTGKLILNFGSASEIAYGIGIAPDGKIVVTGRNDQHTLTIRLLSNGTLDSTFGTGGQKTIDLVGAGDYTYAVAFDAGGKVILAGETNAQFTLIRLNANGSLDGTFHGDNNGGGIVSIPSLGAAYARTVIVEPNGDIVAGGGGEGYYDIVRLRPDGTRDVTFANGGVDRTFDGAPDGGYFSALGAYELDGRLLAMGGVGTSFLMARYLSDNSITVLSSDALADGSFETPVVPGNWVTRFAGESIGMWTVQSGSVDQAASTLWAAADGLQSLDMSGSTAGVIYQDVQTVPGQLYTLRFALAGNTAGGSATKGLNVTWDVASAASPAVVASTTFATSGASPTDMRWAYHEYTLAATVSVMRLRFVSLENSAYGPALDDVTLVPANAVVNGSFEQANGGTPANWTVDSDVVVQDGNAADGGRYAKLGDDTSVGSFHQDVGTSAGQDYRLSFSLGTLDGASVGTQVWWNGELLDTPVPTGNPGSGTLDWVDFGYTVSAVSALTALKFESASDGLGGAAYLDNVQLVPLVKPPAPTNLRAYAASGTRVDLHWQDNSTSETGFVIKSSTDGSNFTVVGHAGSGATNYSVVGLDPNTAYSFLVTAANDGSDTNATGGSADNVGIESEPSNVAQSTTLVNTIDASNLVTVGTWHFNENGTAASGETALPTLLDGIGYRLVAKSVNYCNASYCSWSGCCGSGGMYGDPEYAPAIIEPGVNYCDAGCAPTAAVYGDAEYAWTYDYGLDQDRMPVTDADTELRGTDVGLKISGGIRGSIPNWGDYNESHAYTRDVIGNGQTLGGYYADYDTSDDTGAIELTVQKIISTDTPLPSPSTSGASSVTEGESYTLTLNAGLATGVDSWSVDWGDGNVDSVAGVSQNAIQTVTHVYGDGPGNPSIVATATNAGGSVDAPPRAVEIVPLAPSDLTAVSTSDSQIDLAWTVYSQVASAYSIERSTDGISWAEVATVEGDQTTFQDQTLDEGTEYSYRMRATTGSLYSTYTDVATATTRPSAATNLNAVATSSTEIDLDWDDNSNTNTGYVIKRSTDGINYCCTTALTVDASAEAVTGLLPNTTYYFQVISTGAGGDAISIATAQETTLPAGPLPADIVNLVATISSGPQVDLTWDAADSATDNLRLERRD
jgi:choice-of-anchor C domain-containing protein